MSALWANVADVTSITGAVVNQTTVDQAEGIIETFTGAIASLAVDKLNPRDLVFLKKAVAYQAAFMADHPDFFLRMDVSSMAQDGQSATIKPDGLIIAPMSRRACKRLSWRGSRTLSPYRGAGTLRPDPQGNDEILNWKPIA